MGKRRTVVVISTSSSSSSEENDGGRGSSGSRSRSASISRRKPRKGMTKRGRVSNEESMKVKVEFDILSEDFSECLNDFNLMSGLTTYDRKELWVDKHKPRSLADLAVHKKKVEEVKKWLDERVKISKQPSWGNHTLVLTGQAGVGKSATIHVIASELGAVLYEWTTPTPTLWQEHVHNVNSGVHYISKLEEFENFVEKIRKYSLLQSISSAEPRKPIILLIDDIPMTNGRVAFVRLRKCLTDLTRWTQVPTIILITQCHKTESTGSSAFCWEEVESSLQGAGAHKVTFNPVTVNSIKKSLVRICKEEKCDVTAELIDQIAKASGGDIRHAITSLQYYTIKPECCPFSGSTLSATQSELKSNKLECSLVSRQEERSLNCMVSFPYGKDETLTLFHALGKFLHNKRLAHDVVDQEPDSYTLQEKLRRNPLKMDDPEKVLSQAHGQARSVVEFLYENVLDFINDDAVESASLVISYISDADCLLASNLLSSSCLVKNVRHESESLAHGIATSVAVRGVLFGNSQPSPSRWHTIRSPRVWQIEQSFRFNKDQMLKERFENIRTSGSYMLSDIATDFRPTAKYLTSQKVVGIHTCEELLQDDDVEDYSDWSNIDNSEGMNSDNNEEDDIEDW
ncbi:cell cycle checkpoint protein RAD17 isoform X3 [Typha latifolia]|uniref:cell cycle checkpoint protein RAD17 isoform X3 n=1 Tax=Typha latifolia TaxID=4733 RepID=UPI003C2B4DC9